MPGIFIFKIQDRRRLLELNLFSSFPSRYAKLCNIRNSGEVEVKYVCNRRR